MQLEYSLNGGNFTELGVYNDTNALNWYNDDHLAGTTDPAWTGNSNGWIHSNCKLHNLNGQNIQFRFIFRSDGVGSRDGYSIDDVHFALSGQDARIRNINSPDSSFESTTLQTVSATIINCGNDTLFNFPVSFQIDNGTPVTIMYVDTLLSLQSDSISFPSQLIPSGGHKIKVYTSVPQDENPSNDSHEMVVAVISTVSTPYTESFDVTGGGWMFSSQLSGSMWDLGYPICSTIGSSHSIPNCWNIGLTGLYNNNSNSILTSPIFLIDSGSTYLVDFWQNYDTENEWDGTRLEYRINNNPYLILGTVNDPNATNWYTNPQIFTSLLPAWEGLSNGWLRSSYIMTGINSSTIQFRFVFDSDWSVTGDGYAIDDFSISKVTGLAQLNNEILLNLYPNPVRDELCIKSDLILNYIITDMTGRTLMTGKSKSGRNLIDVSTFQQGAFLFICSDINGRTRTLKFIKG